MPDVRNTPAKAKSAKNWPMLAAAILCVTFIVGVWVNNYRVSHAAAQAPITSNK